MSWYVLVSYWSWKNVRPGRNTDANRGEDTTEEGLRTQLAGRHQCWRCHVPSRLFPEGIGTGRVHHASPKLRAWNQLQLKNLPGTRGNKHVETSDFWRFFPTIPNLVPYCPMISLPGGRHDERLRLVRGFQHGPGSQLVRPRVVRGAQGRGSNVGGSDPGPRGEDGGGGPGANPDQDWAGGCSCHGGHTSIEESGWFKDV